MTRIFNKEFLSILLLLIISLSFFWRGVIADRITLIWDAADAFYPILAFNAHYVKNGLLPLWNPSLFSGYPTFADPQAQTFYPINLIVALLTTFTPKVVYCLLVFHCFLAGTFMFSLCRHLKYTLVASLVGAISFMLSGFMVGHFQHLTQICSIAWFPIIFLFFDKTLEKRRLEYVLIGAFFLCMSILAGHPQSYYYICFVLGIHWIYKTVTILKKPMKELLFNIKAGILFFGFGIMLAMIQLLPTIEFMQLSTRSEAVSLASSGVGIKLKHLITILIPNFYGGISATGEGYLNWIGGIEISQQNLYMGVLPILIAGWVIIYGRGKRRIYFLAMSITAFLISMGINTPLYAIFYKYVFGFSLFNRALNFFFVFHFFMGILAAQGMTTLLKHKTTLRKFLLYLMIFLIGITTYYLILPKAPGEAMALKTSEGGKLMFIMLFSLSACIIFLTSYLKSGRWKWIRQVVPVLLFFDIFFLTSNTITIGREFHNRGTVSSHNMLENHVGKWSEIQALAGLEQGRLVYHSSSLDLSQHYKNVELFRVYINRENRPFTSKLLKYIGYHIPILHGIFLVDGYFPMVVKRHSDLTQFIGGISTKRVMELYNARYQISVHTHKKTIQEIKPYLDRAVIVENAEFINDKEAILNRLADPSFDPYSTVIVEEKGIKQARTMPDSSDNALNSQVKILRYLPNRIDMETKSMKSGYLLLNETFYPGWRAFVDNQETKIYRANYNFQAIRISEGKHKVSFVFNPISLKIGAAISVITMSIFIILFLWQMLPFYRQRKNFRKNSDERQL